LRRLGRQGLKRETKFKCGVGTIHLHPLSIFPSEYLRKVPGKEKSRGNRFCPLAKRKNPSLDKNKRFCHTPELLVDSLGVLQTARKRRIGRVRTLKSAQEKFGKRDSDRGPMADPEHSSSTNGPQKGCNQHRKLKDGWREPLVTHNQS